MAPEVWFDMANSFHQVPAVRNFGLKEVFAKSGGTDAVSKSLMKCYHSYRTASGSDRMLDSSC